MKHFLRGAIILITMTCHAGGALFAQEDPPDFLFRAYEDNDVINMWEPGSDNAYTNGTRFDLFYTKKNPAHGIDRLLPKAGSGSIDTYGWGIMQLMYTPDDISRGNYQPNDYPYSGALIAIHSLYSYNPVEKFDWQTELVAGVIGPASLAEQAQDLLHRITAYQQPKGWPYQFRTDLLVNINLTAEKQLASWGHTLEVIGGSQLSLGTMQNAAALYPMIRFGKMTPYFQGYMSQYSSVGTAGKNKRIKKWQAYFLVKPEAQFFATNALLEGGVFTGNPNIKGHKEGTKPPPYHKLENWVFSLNYGAVVSSGNFSISFMQNTSSTAMKGLYCHQVGNISLYFAW